MNINETIASLRESASNFAADFLPGLTPETVRLAVAVTLGLVAVSLFLVALRLLFGGRRKPGLAKRVNIARTLQQQGAIIDLLGNGDEIVAVRFVITAAASGRLQCEIIERLDVIRTPEGTDAVCVFAPVRAEGGQVNSFTARLIESDRSGRRVDRITLAAPSGYAMIPRRRHTRKRVADQQFIRVKLWAEDPYASDILFEDAAPHIGVNSLTPEGANQSANAVVNISNGGLGLSVQDRFIPETCAVGAAVTLNLFMFNFREKTFKPYWYSGSVRSMKTGRPGFTRMGIEFDGSAQPLGPAGGLRWTRFSDD
ncbi:MAG: hypothetical protein KUA35_05005 [Pseudodesulfovibrio sp.]|uniref:Uncharacterized protein n=1 Tax=Pseudodesulfovibrio aespoeensis (strain ATCC 700646 / DSM 10631 / Aspo-2) TaxID=643562 RepID=E6VRL2_PSEA9|nr:MULTISPECIES: hypothetical protein [Pseudodesulfovibrio]MBU4191863.1 hypothetical protein [Pseudomonadota bacterium]ADU63049.1 hypothetical protein Daes_2041 [Pseudodesulfovibrio aespoeensis Aspo-2]MBU4244550.1 hypothetical protein [Pseudomonadota bacterium]MBU4377908.1 hypothetical protein [Pseudomonadota bacterium]MBU4475846.1 hypothetical protein [Pseudomonadota bacterium]